MELEGSWAYLLTKLKPKVKTKTQSEDTAERFDGRLKYRPQTSNLRPQTPYLELPANYKQKATKSLRNWGVPLFSNEKFKVRKLKMYDNF